MENQNTYVEIRYQIKEPKNVVTFGVPKKLKMLLE
jgi:hypothetical protein